MDLDYIKGMNLGYGFNTATYDIHSPALADVTSTRDVVGGGGQEVYFKVELSSSTLSLSQQLNVSARASLKYGLVASGSLKTSFLSEFKQNSFSVYVVVQTIVSNKQTLLDLSKVKFKDAAAKLFTSDSQSFTQQYGDSFVYGLITGGEFLGILQIESSSASEFREVKAKLSGKGSYGLFSGSASVNFEQSLQSITSEYSMKATILQQGGTGLAAKSVTSGDLIRAALSFPKEVEGDKGFPYVALIMPYNHIERPIASPLDLSNQTAALEQLGSWRERFIKYQNDLEFALSHPEQFPGINTSSVSDRYNDISNEIKKVVDAARYCFNDQTKCTIPILELSLLEDILPPQIQGTSEETMLSGTESKVYYKTGSSMELANPPGPRFDIIRVNFPAGKFSNPPKVQTALSHIDTENETNTRLAVSPQNISVSGFDINVSTWSDSKVYAVSIAWFAHTE
jgi:hypothetical protein